MAHVKAQVSTEFIIVMTGVLLVVIALVSANLEILRSHEDNVRIIKVKDTIDTIYKNAEHVYKQGENSKSKIFIMIPNGVESTTFFYNESDMGYIEINLSVDGISRSVFRTTRFNITGNIPIEEGYYWLNVISRGNYVEIN
jgi:hypothetical protein